MPISWNIHHTIQCLIEDFQLPRKLIKCLPLYRLAMVSWIKLMWLMVLTSPKINSLIWITKHPRSMFQHVDMLHLEKRSYTNVPVSKEKFIQLIQIHDQWWHDDIRMWISFQYRIWSELLHVIKRGLHLADEHEAMKSWRSPWLIWDGTCVGMHMSHRKYKLCLLKHTTYSVDKNKQVLTCQQCLDGLPIHH